MRLVKLVAFSTIVLAMSILAGCASNESMVEGCVDIADEMHPVAKVPFVLTGCMAAAVGDEVAAVGKTVVVAPPVAAASRFFEITNKGAEPKQRVIHGNWCGPNHPKQGTDPGDPVDELDRACQTHDLCYQREGYFSCKCDTQLIKEIRDVANIPEGLKVRAGLVAQYFEHSYCRGCKQHWSGRNIHYSCHDPEEFGCKLGPVSLKQAYAWCPNSKDSYVIELQHELRRLRCRLGRVDGKYDVSTKKGVKRFYSSRNEPDSIYDKKSSGEILADMKNSENGLCDQVNGRSRNDLRSGLDGERAFPEGWGARYMDRNLCLREADGSAVIGFEPDRCE